MSATTTTTTSPSYFSDSRAHAREAGHDAKLAVADAKAAARSAFTELKAIPSMPVPAFADIAKPANDLLNKDFYHTAAANLEVKSKAPNGVNYTVKGKSAHEGPLTGSLEGKYADKAAGITGTLSWSTLNVLDAKLELEENIAKGLKVEALGSFKPDAKNVASKLNLYFKQPAFHMRAFVDLLKGPTATVDAVIGHEGFVVGGEAGYDVQKAAVTRYSAAIGYQHSVHSASITATNNLSVYSASYYHRVNTQVEAGAKATWDSKGSGAVGLEVASKYIIDPTSFAKAKINDRGIAALAYNIKVKPGFTFGIGASFDTQKLNEGGHKVGANFVFEG